MTVIGLAALDSSGFRDKLQSSKYCNSMLGKFFLIAGVQILKLIYIWQV